MSSTSKARLQAVKDQLDALFGNCHSDDRQELVKDLQEYLSGQNSAAKRPGYDKHANSATSSLNA